MASCFEKKNAGKYRLNKEMKSPYGVKKSFIYARGSTNVLTKRKKWQYEFLRNGGL